MRRASLPGAYTDVHFKLPVAERGVGVAANTLLFCADGPRIATGRRPIVMRGLSQARRVAEGAGSGPARRPDHSSAGRMT
jgi:hypothetical protein